LPQIESRSNQQISSRKRERSKKRFEVIKNTENSKAESVQSKPDKQYSSVKKARKIELNEKPYSSTIKNLEQAYNLVYSDLEQQAAILRKQQAER
jgi:hypothetical protein